MNRTDVIAGALSDVLARAPQIPFRDAADHVEHALREWEEARIDNGNALAVVAEQAVKYGSVDHRRRAVLAFLRGDLVPEEG